MISFWSFLIFCFWFVSSAYSIFKQYCVSNTYEQSTGFQEDHDVVGACVFLVAADKVLPQFFGI